MAVIALTTDFGVQDAYVGMMKGVIAGIAPDASVIDICHEVRPQDLDHGALVLWSAVPAFPDGTIHCVVVDPGVGSQRRAIAVEADGMRFVAPDNGVIWPAVQRASSWKGVVLDRPEWFRHPVSHTFHGRDIFSPVSAHWAAGRTLEELGSPLDALVECTLFDATDQTNMIEGRIATFDHFGNAMTNIPGSWLVERRVKAIRIGKHVILGLARTFSDVGEGELVAYINSFGLLECAICNGSAERAAGWDQNQRVEVLFH